MVNTQRGMVNTQAFREKDLELLVEAIETDDIRTVLKGRKVHRKRIARAAYAAQKAGIITSEEFSAVAGKIERPKAFPSDPEQRLEAVLAGFMNAESKQILVMLLNSGITDPGALAHQFVLAVGESWTRDNVAENLGGYIVNSLDPIGFVAYPVVARQQVGDVDVGYALTEAGRLYGLPLAAFALGLANKTGLSLQQILGTTHTVGDSRSPYNRFRILEELLKGDCRMADLALTLNLANNVVSNHLKALRKIGFVEFDSIGPEDRGWAIHRWSRGVPSDVKTIKEHKTLTGQVADYLFKHGSADYRDVFEHLASVPMYEGGKESSLKSSIRAVISGLARQGFIERQTDYKGAAVYSHVSLTRKEREFAKDFTGKIRSAVSGGAELEAMRSVYNGYVSDFGLFSQHAARGMRLYLPVSHGANKKPSEVGQAQVIDYLQARQGARSRDLIKAFGRGAVGHLRSLVAAGILVKTRGPGPGVFYELAKTA